MAAINYVSDYGITYGNQLFGSLFFFVPREYWYDKPLNSGKLIGQYLIKRHMIICVQNKIIITINC